MAKTQRGKFVFTVKEYAEGKPWIALEPLDEEATKVFEDSFIGFDLPDEANLDKAKEIAKYLNENLVKLAYTSLKGE